MHKKIHDHGKSYCQNAAVQEADRFNVPSEHNRINFHGKNDISM